MSNAGGSKARRGCVHEVIADYVARGTDYAIQKGLDALQISIAPNSPVAPTPNA
jgi:hypothetical protein